MSYQNRFLLADMVNSCSASENHRITKESKTYGQCKIQYTALPLNVTMLPLNILCYKKCKTDEKDTACAKHIICNRFYLQHISGAGGTQHPKHQVLSRWWVLQSLELAHLCVYIIACLCLYSYMYLDYGNKNV